MRTIFFSFLFNLFALCVHAEERILERSELLDIVSGKILVLRLFGIELKVFEDGTIEGKAMGWNVKGEWEWQDGFFCRSMWWGERDIGFNCQEVTIKNKKIKFTSDRGNGASARFSLK